MSKLKNNLNIPLTTYVSQAEHHDNKANHKNYWRQFLHADGTIMLERRISLIYFYTDVNNLDISSPIWIYYMLSVHFNNITF